MFVRSCATAPLPYDIGSVLIVCCRKAFEKEKYWQEIFASSFFNHRFCNRSGGLDRSFKSNGRAPGARLHPGNLSGHSQAAFDSLSKFLGRSEEHTSELQSPC